MGWASERMCEIESKKLDNQEAFWDAAPELISKVQQLSEDVGESRILLEVKEEEIEELRNELRKANSLKLKLVMLGGGAIAGALAKEGITQLLALL